MFWLVISCREFIYYLCVRVFMWWLILKRIKLSTGEKAVVPQTPFNILQALIGIAWVKQRLSDVWYYDYDQHDDPHVILLADKQKMAGMLACQAFISWALCLSERTRFECSSPLQRRCHEIWGEEIITRNVTVRRIPGPRPFTDVPVQQPSYFIWLSNW